MEQLSKLVEERPDEKVCALATTDFDRYLMAHPFRR